MAPPTQVSSNPEVQSQYLTQVAITAGMNSALRRLWATVQPLSGRKGEGQYRAGVQLLSDHFGQASISSAADYYASLRTDAKVTAPFKAPLATPPPESLVNADLDWAMRARQQMEDDAARIQARVEAAMQKALADAGREQVVASVEGDDAAIGFVRVPRPGACAWCLSLSFRRSRKVGQVGRPGVYKSRQTAGQLPPNALGDINRYHNNCHCTVEPVFSLDHQLEPHVLDAEQLYNESAQTPGDYLNDFRRALAQTRDGRKPRATPAAPDVAPLPQANAFQDLLDRLAS